MIEPFSGIVPPANQTNDAASRAALSQLELRIEEDRTARDAARNFGQTDISRIPDAPANATVETVQVGTQGADATAIDLGDDNATQQQVEPPQFSDLRSTSNLLTISPDRLLEIFSEANADTGGVAPPSNDAGTAEPRTADNELQPLSNSQVEDQSAIAPERAEVGIAGPEAQASDTGVIADNVERASNASQGGAAGDIVAAETQSSATREPGRATPASAGDILDLSA